ncbi:MAG: bifunctional UDP-N-acetylglucosamine diphosphorylase/glucosamine-1-phosphate N-acetyltransferase GlmU [Candidatus Saccharicenans sp.]|uniref:bifunctional UDP-N-acetylglucosamine diphosphorylase/glucosamine-1-phosphate N-acetyltransferase GlmU n=1 Tax=Candidatus Saccharicenans sp. TaxID=2819258 RepID=UPI004049B9F9
MKNKLLVVACGDRVPGDQKRTLPSIISPESLNHHLLNQLMKLRPQRTALLTSGPMAVGKSLSKGLKFLPVEALSYSLASLIEKIVRGRSGGDLLLMSFEFFPGATNLLQKILKFHRDSEYDLTLVGERETDTAGSQGEDYFVYPGLALIRDGETRKWLTDLHPFKPSGQLDVVALVEAAWAADKRIGFYWVKEADKDEFILVNSLADYSRVAEFLRQLRIAELERRGVFFLDPASTWVDLRSKVGRGTVIYPSVIIEGRSKIGKDCLIYPHCHIINSRLGNLVKVFGATVIEGGRVEDEAQVGPFSRLRPETWLRRGSHVGNFVEMKKTVFGKGSKAMHLSYLGDTRVGEKVNVGAGTITCNYDGIKKNKTFIDREAFIGSGTELVAPVRVGRGAYVAAGSTITENVKPGALAIARARQVQKMGWVKGRKARLLESGKKLRQNRRNRKKGK